MQSLASGYNSTMNERLGDDLILERMYAREQVLLSQADALDMKASYLLIVLVFLAQLSTTFLTRPLLSCIGKSSQWLSCLLLLASGVFLLLEMRVKTFRGEHALELEPWRDRVIREAQVLEEYQAAPSPEEFMRNRLVWGLIDSSKLRIARSEQNNTKKVDHLKLAYWFAAGAFLLDILFLIVSGLYSGL